MGKIKRERQKYHITAEKGDGLETIESEIPKQTPLKFQLNTVQNIFAGINIQLSDINKFEETPLLAKKPIDIEEKAKPDRADKTSTKTNHESVPDKGKILTKKDKMALKHQKLMKKLDVTQQARLQSQKKNKKKGKQTNAGDQTLLETSQLEVRSLLTPAAIRPSIQNVNEKVTKNVFSMPLFNDDLPALNSVYEIPKDNFSMQSKSKSISKKSYGKKGFVKNYNFLKKAMAKKRS